MDTLFSFPVITPTRLAIELQIHRTTASRHLNEMESGGLLKLSLREFFLTSLQHLLVPMQKQAESFKSLASQIAANTHQDFTLQEFSDLYADPLASVSRLDVFNALMRGPKKQRPQRAEQFNEIVATLEFVRLEKERTSRHLSDFIQAHGRYLQTWNENANAVIRQFDALITFTLANNSRVADDPFLAELDRIVHGWSGIEGRRNFQVVRNDLLNPIREHCRSHRDDLRTMTFLLLIVNCFSAHDNIIHLKSLYSDSFSEQGDKLLAKREALSKSIEFFSIGG